MPTIWNQHFSQPESSQTLPLAVAMLFPSASGESIDQQIKKIRENLPFVKSIWLGETDEPVKDFATARNLVLEQIAEPWIFWLDSDETLSDVIENFHQLKELLERENVAGFRISRKDVFHHQVLKFGEVGQVEILRIHRPKAGKFINHVHEVFQLNSPGNLDLLPLKLFHRSHNSISEFLTKISHYASIRAEERLRLPRPPSKTQLLWELILWPTGKFFWNYFWLQGFRDGYRGLIYAVMMSLHSCLVRVFGLELLIGSKLKSQNEN